MLSTPEALTQAIHCCLSVIMAMLLQRDANCGVPVGAAGLRLH